MTDDAVERQVRGQYDKAGTERGRTECHIELIPPLLTQLVAPWQ
jgi:hypothetical protein